MPCSGTAGIALLLGLACQKAWAGALPSGRFGHGLTANDTSTVWTLNTPGDPLTMQRHGDSAPLRTGVMEMRPLGAKP